MKARHVSITNFMHEANSDQRKLGKLSGAYLELVYSAVSCGMIHEYVAFED
jgi:hypothetical protein